MNPLKIIEKYYDKESKLYKILISHSEQVRDKAMAVAKNRPELEADVQFIEEAAMLHDIGIYLTHAPSIECFGSFHYIAHGYLGADILREEGYPHHALVCERHTGTGLSKEWIISQKLPLPHRDMVPVTIEEQIICYADSFFSKTKIGEELTVEEIIRKMRKFSDQQEQQFIRWHQMFS